MTTTQDTAIPLADNVIGASQGGHGLGPTSLSGRIALLTRFAELVAHTRKSGHARCRIQRPSAALGVAAEVGRRLGSVAHADAGRAAAVTDGVRKQPRAPDGIHAAGRAVRLVHATVQHERPAGDQPAGALQRRGPPHPDPAGRLWAGRHLDPCRLPTGTGTPLVARPPGDPVTPLSAISNLSSATGPSGNPTSMQPRTRTPAI